MKRSTLPPMRDLAEDLREGADFDALCVLHDVTPGTLAGRLSYAGYGVTGQPLRVEATRTPLSAGGIGEGNYVSGGVGGGDYSGLPTQLVPHTRRKREFIGLDWTTRPASGPQWRWV